MAVEFKDIWDFHTDLRLVMRPGGDRPYLRDQLDVPAAARLGGVFSATERFADLPKDVQLERLEEDVALIRGAEGMHDVLSAGDLKGTGGQILHAEGMYFIEEEADLALLDRLWDLGVRSLAPLYNEDNALGGGARGESARGLTPLGRDLAMRSWKMGFLFDCAHANHRTKEGLIDIALVTGHPLHYSHGHLDEPYAAVFGERGLPREMARRLLETGGFIGLCPHPGFLAAFSRHLEEIEFLAEIGPDQVVLGSDFAGTNVQGPEGIRLFEECKGIWGVPAFAERLAALHGEDFARAYCGASLRGLLERTLPA